MVIRGFSWLHHARLSCDDGDGGGLLGLVLEELVFNHNGFQAVVNRRF